MPRQKKFQWSQTGEAEQNENLKKSRSQLKRESTALQELGMKLAKVPIAELEALGLDLKLIKAFRELPHITSNEARRRHFQYIGKLMRDIENPEELKKLVDN